MEANGKQQRLNEAKQINEFLKLIFQYPSSDHAVIKRGYVLDTHSDSFDFDEIYDGKVTYAYDFLIEIKKGEKGC